MLYAFCMQATTSIRIRTETHAQFLRYAASSRRSLMDTLDLASEFDPELIDRLMCELDELVPTMDTLPRDRLQKLLDKLDGGGA